MWIQVCKAVLEGGDTYSNMWSSSVPDTQFQKSPVAAHMYGTHILRMDFLGMRNWCHQNGFIVGGFVFFQGKKLMQISTDIRAL